MALRPRRLIVVVFNGMYSEQSKLRFHPNAPISLEYWVDVSWNSMDEKKKWMNFIKDFELFRFEWSQILVI